MIPIAQKDNLQLAVPNNEVQREDPGFSPLHLLLAIRRRLWMAIGIGLILAVVTGPAIWAFLPPPKPNVTTSLFMYSNTEGTLFPHPDAQLNAMTQIAIIKSDKVISVALLVPEIGQLPLVKAQADPIDWLSKNLRVNYPYGNEILQISLSDPNTDDAIKVVNAVRTAYLDEVFGNTSRSRKDRLEKLTSLQRNALENLKRKQLFLEKYGEVVGSTNPDNAVIQQRLAAEDLMSARKELYRLESELRTLKIHEKILLRAPAANKPATPAEINAAVEADYEVAELTKVQLATDAVIRDIDKKGTEGAKTLPAYIDAKAKLAELEPLIKAARLRARTEYLAIYAIKVSGDAQGKLAAIRQQIEDQSEFQQYVAKDVESRNLTVTNVKKASIQLEAEKIDLSILEEHYRKVASAITTLVAESDQPPRVKPLDDSASVERVDLTTRKIQFACGGAIAAFLLGCIIVGFFEHRTQRLDSVEAIGTSCGVTILGTVPRFPSANWRALGAASVRWQTALAESVDCTRTFLLHGPGLTGIRSVLITSAESGEGKSSFAAQLAVSFARGGMRTLLVDGDMRKPGVSMLVGVENGDGLAELLRGEVVLPDVLRTSRIPGLTVITAGRCDDYALAALAQDRNTIRSLQTLYDIVVVDSAPILPVTDPLHLARQVDGVILATLQDFSRSPLIREAADRLRRLGIRIIGAIVNGTPNRVYGYGYHYQSHGPAIAAKPVEINDTNATTVS